MALLETIHTKIDGVAACVPSRIVDNSSYPYLEQDEIKKYIATTGIERRHCAVPDGKICCSDLCFQAADVLLNDLKWDRSQIDLLVFVSQTQDYKLPATSCILQDRLGLSTRCMSFDISYGCSGFVYGLSVVSAMMSLGFMNKALLLVGNTQSFYASPQDKSLALLFGDAGTATAISYDESVHDTMNFNLCSDGSGKDLLIVPDGGCRNPVTNDSFKMQSYEDGISRTRLHESMDGAEVFSFGLSKAPSVCKELLEHFQIEHGDIDYLCLHQANRFLCEKIRKKLKFELEQVPYNLQDFGNTSGASIPLLMVTELQEVLRSKPTSILSLGFGVGLSWGAAKFITRGIVVPELLTL